MSESDICVTRVHLKTDTPKREHLIDYCLHSRAERGTQYIAVGWSCVYELEDGTVAKPDSAEAFFTLYDRWRRRYRKRTDHVINVFSETLPGDLFWTRDLDGCYWICRATGTALPLLDEELDIGIVVPVDAYPVGHEVPGQVRASFNRPRGGTSESFHDKMLVEYSKHVYNQCSNCSAYTVERQSGGDLISNLPALELEELMITYLQLEKDLYVLSNSIASKSTSIKVECELLSRTNPGERAVVQVKGGSSHTLYASEFQFFVDAGTTVYLKAPVVILDVASPLVVEITNEQLQAFYAANKQLLPHSITRWENLFT